MSTQDDKQNFGYGADISAGSSLNQEQNPFASAGRSGPPAVEQHANRNASPNTSGNAGILDMGQRSKSEPVKDISTAEFMTEVIEASSQVPVLVDFWAPWCGPCKQLGPALEAAVAKAGGRVRLVKMNIDEHPEVAGQMGIQSIPAVVAFVNGQPRDAFMGNKPESEIKNFIDKLVGPSARKDPLADALEQAGELMASEAWSEAAGLYGAILQQLPDNEDALAGYGNANLKLGQVEQAKQALSAADPASQHPGITGLKTAIDLHEQAEALGDVESLRKAVEDSPGDHQRRFDLALALNAHGEREAAAEALLEIVRRDRKWHDDGAKEQLVKFFEAWGPKDPATQAGRRGLSSVLFS